MARNIESRLAAAEDLARFLEAQAMAQRNFAMAQIEALNELVPGFAKTMAAKADLKRRAAAHIGELAWAENLESLLDELRERFDLPAND